MIRRELLLATGAAIAGSALTTLLMTGINSAYAVGPAPSLQSLNERVHKLEARAAADEQEQQASSIKRKICGK